MIRTTTIICYVLLFCSQLAWNQNPVFTNLGVRNGLPATEVYHLFQDKNGYVWAFTEYGIVKHNGSGFTAVCTNIPFKERAVYAVTEAPDGTMYFANSKCHIYKIVNDRAFIVPGSAEIAKKIINIEGNQVIVGLTVCDDATLWYSTFFKSYSLKDRTVSHKKSSKITPKGGKPFLKFNGDYVELTNSKRVLRRFYNAPETPVRFNLHEQGKDCYLSIHETIYRIRNNTIVDSSAVAMKIIAFKIAPDGSIWVGVSHGGLYKLDARLSVVGHFMGNMTVSDILFDDQSGMWVSTIGQGIYYCPNIYSFCYDANSGLDKEISMLKKIDGKLFIGTSAGELLVKDGQGFSRTDLSNHCTQVSDIIRLHGHYLICTDATTLKADRTLRSFTVYTSKFRGYAFMQSDTDELITVSTSFIDRENLKTRMCMRLKVKNIPRSVGLRGNKEVLIGTSSGVYLLGHNNHIYHPSWLDALRNKRISSLETDSKGMVWICTKGDGLYCLRTDNTLKHFAGTPSEVINDISFMHDTIVLLSTNRGAFINSVRKMNSKASWISVLEEETLHMEYFEDQLYIATKSGLRTMAANHLFTPVNYQFYLRSVSVDNKQMPLRNFTLSYPDNDILLSFDLLSYRFPDQSLHYDLHGPSGIKGTVTGRDVQLQNLEPGNYMLDVYPETDRLNSKRKLIRIPFAVEPAFWQTRMFHLLVILSSMGSICLVVYFLKRKKRHKSKVEKLLAEYRLTALKSQINPHFMSNALVAIQQLILSDESDKAGLYLAKFSQLIRYLLEYSDKSVVSIAAELKLIQLYVELEHLRFSDAFVFRKEIDSSVNLQELFIPSLITQPLIENAIWHGLLPMGKGSNSELLLKLFIENEALHIAISDNGVGRKRENPKVAVTGDRTSKGVGLIRNRIESLNELYTGRNSNVFYTDHTDTDNNPTGTTVTLVFPLQLLNTLYHEHN
jgi:hypothetical protein